MGTMLSGSPPFVIHVLLSWRCEDHLACEVHVRFCEGMGVRFPRATRLLKGKKFLKHDRDPRRATTIRMPESLTHSTLLWLISYLDMMFWTGNFEQVYRPKRETL